MAAKSLLTVSSRPKAPNGVIHNDRQFKLNFYCEWHGIKFALIIQSDDVALKSRKCVYRLRRRLVKNRRTEINKNQCLHCWYGGIVANIFKRETMNVWRCFDPLRFGFSGYSIGNKIHSHSPHPIESIKRIWTEQGRSKLVLIVETYHIRIPFTLMAFGKMGHSQLPGRILYLIKYDVHCILRGANSWQWNFMSKTDTHTMLRIN